MTKTTRDPTDRWALTIADPDRVADARAAMLAQMGRGGEVIRIGRYDLAGQLATGGMAAVHLGRIRGAQGFSRVVVIKRILPEYASKPDFVRMFVNEARLAARVRHPNVVATLDAVEHDDELLLIMEFVHGLPLAKLMSLATGANGRIPLRIGAAVLASSLRGIHAAHEAKDEQGRPLTIVLDHLGKQGRGVVFDDFREHIVPRLLVPVHRGEVANVSFMIAATEQEVVNCGLSALRDASLTVRLDDFPIDEWDLLAREFAIRADMNEEVAEMAISTYRGILGNKPWKPRSLLTLKLMYEDAVRGAT